MDGLTPLKERHLLRNQEEYQVKYNYLKFPSPEEAATAMQERQTILSAIESRVKWGFHNSKVDVTNLSKGCQLCGEGQWSCLFINNLCNGKCFYCPTLQTDMAQPVTNTLTFDDPETYVDYIRKFGFKGVSISGGEPLISFEKSLAFWMRALTCPLTTVRLCIKTATKNRQTVKNMHRWWSDHGRLLPKMVLSEGCL